jgi:hypothetical protein
MTTPPEDWTHGTARKPDAPNVAWIGPELVRSALGEWGAWAGHLIPIVGQTPVDVEQLCSAPPDPSWELGAGDILGAVATPGGMFSLPPRIVNASKLAIWPTLCQFTPAPDPVAEPTPVYEPPPPPPVPPDLEPPPVEPTPPEYDEPTLWALVFEYLRQIKAIVERNQVLVTWLADNTQTLEWEEGHTIDIQGAGVAGLYPADGYMVVLEQIPATLGRGNGPEPTLFDAGWFGFGGFYGFEHKHRLAHTWNLFYPSGYEAAQIAWDLAPGVRGYVTALLRKPYPDAPDREGPAG